MCTKEAHVAHSHTARYGSESPSDTSSTSQSELRVPSRSLRCPISENWECPLCLAECSSEFFPELLCCTHRSCLDCLQQYLRIEISESRVNINCPECSEPMHPNGEYRIPFLFLFQSRHKWKWFIFHLISFLFLFPLFLSWWRIRRHSIDIE